MSQNGFLASQERFQPIPAVYFELGSVPEQPSAGRTNGSHLFALADRPRQKPSDSCAGRNDPLLNASHYARLKFHRVVDIATTHIQVHGETFLFVSPAPPNSVTTRISWTEGYRAWFLSRFSSLASETIFKTTSRTAQSGPGRKKNNNGVADCPKTKAKRELELSTSQGGTTRCNVTISHFASL